MFAARNAKEAMSSRLLVLRDDQDILDALRLLVENQLSGAPVVDALGELVGMLTERDCLRIALEAGYYSAISGTVADFMSVDVRTVDANTPTIEVAELFVNCRYRRLPVLEDGRLIGIIARRDVLRQLSAAWPPA